MANINFDAAVKNYMNGMPAGAAVEAAAYDAAGYGFDVVGFAAGAVEVSARAVRHFAEGKGAACHAKAAEKRGETFSAELTYWQKRLDNPAAESIAEEEEEVKEAEETEEKEEEKAKKEEVKPVLREGANGVKYANLNFKVKEEDVNFLYKTDEDEKAETYRWPARILSGASLTRKEGKILMGNIFMKEKGKKGGKRCGFWKTGIKDNGEEYISVWIFLGDSAAQIQGTKLFDGSPVEEDAKSLKLFFGKNKKGEWDKKGVCGAFMLENYVRTLIDAAGWRELDDFEAGAVEDISASAKEEVKKAPAKSAKKTAAAKKEGKKTATKKAEKKKLSFKADTKTQKLFAGNVKLMEKVVAVVAEYDLGAVEYDEDASNEKVAVFFGTAADNTRFGSFSITLSTGNFKKKFAWEQ